MRMRINYVALLLGMLAVASTAQAQQHLFQPSYGFAPAAPTGYYDQEEAPVPDGEGEIVPDTNGGAGSCTDGACTDPACQDCQTCTCEECCPSLFTKLRPAPGWFGSAEYMLMWNKTRSIPPLVTTGPSNPGNPFNILGLNDPGVQVLFGDSPTGDGLGSGGRLTLGKWLDDYETFALAGKFWGFRGNDGSFSTSSNGLTNIGLPFIDAQTGLEEAYIVGFTPNGVNAFSSGTISVQDRLDMLGAEAYAQFLVYDQPGMRVDLIGGYHALRLDNSLQISSTLTSLDAAYIAPVGSTIGITDTFEGRNEFNGGEFGLAVNSFYDRFSFNMLGKISIGNMHQTVITQGNTVIGVPGLPPDIRNEGLFALGTNIGSQSRDKIAYIPEVNAKIGYWVHPNVNVSLGYTFMYINSVVLGGDQVDRTLNLSQTNGGPLIGPARPTFLGFRETDYWVQGLTFGVECKF